MQLLILNAEEELKRILEKYGVDKASDILDLIENNVVPSQIAFQDYLLASELEKVVGGRKMGESIY